MISVVIPTYNEEKLIEKTLRQFIPFRKKFNLQIIVSDDNSTDKTVNIAKQFADIVVKNESLRGVSGNRNNGAKLAIHDVIVFMDADTKIKKVNYFLNCILNKFKDKCVAGAYVKIQGMPDERSLSDILFHGFFYFYVWFLDLFKVPMAGGQCHIVRKSFFENVKYDVKLNTSEDIDMMLRMKKYGSVRLLKGPIVFESNRRYKKWGYLRTLYYWMINGFYVMFLKRPYLKEWETIR